MSVIETGGIDCDIHPAVPNLKALFPYLTDHWRDIVVQRGTNHLWRNPSESEYCRIVFILVEALPLKINGVEVPESHS